MTSTEVADPLAHVREGNSVGEYNDWQNATSGIWTSRSYTWCAAQGPRTQYACSRPIGHPASWNHMACTSDGHGGRGTVHEVWSGTPALEVDPHAAVTVGIDRGYDGWNEIYAGDIDNWCRVTNGRYSCSRPHGHPAHWQHIACDSRSVVDVWPGEVPGADPWAHTKENDYLGDLRNWNDDVTGIRVHNSQWCRETKEGRNPGGVCTRPHDHFGQHISTSDTRVLWTKPNTRVATPPPPPDPEDGSPVDDESIVYTEAPEVGDVVRLRDRKNRLYVMAKRKDSPEVEVLDLERKELRAIPVDRCVKQDAPLTVEELQWVAQWYAGHRDAVRKIAVREYRKDRWCMDGLNQNLRTLGLPKYEPSLRGRITVQLPFECSDIHAGQDGIEAKVNAALRNPEVSAALRVALPPIDGIELQPDDLTVRATDFQRK